MVKDFYTPLLWTSLSLALWVGAWNRLLQITSKTESLETMVPPIVMLAASVGVATAGVRISRSWGKVLPLILLVCEGTSVVFLAYVLSRG